MKDNNVLIVNFNGDATWVPITFLGKNISVQILPFDSSIAADLSQKHTSYELVRDANGELIKDPKTDTYIRLAKFDSVGYMKDLLDHHIKGIKGVGVSRTRALELTPENKYRLCHLPVPENEQLLADIILAESRALAILKDAEVQKEDENLK